MTRDLPRGPEETCRPCQGTGRGLFFACAPCGGTGRIRPLLPTGRTVYLAARAPFLRRRSPNLRRDTLRPPALPSPEWGSAGGEVGAPRVRGTVGWFHRAKGVGYLIEDGEEDARVAVHFSEIDAPKNRRTLYCGQRVEFRVVETPKGRRARGVRVISEAQEATFNLP